MILVLFFLFVFMFATAATMVKARGDISDTWSREGPGRIAEHLRRRNRTILLVTVVLLIVVAFLEAIVPDIHYGLEDMQFVVGDYLNASPTGVITFGSGAGLSWGLYLSIGFAALAGIWLGTVVACRSFGSTQGIEALQLI